jgi:hypothetical protein
VGGFTYTNATNGFGEGELVVPANALNTDQLKWTGAAGAQIQLIDYAGGSSLQFCVPEDGRIAAAHYLDSVVQSPSFFRTCRSQTGET